MGALGGARRHAIVCPVLYPGLKGLRRLPWRIPPRLSAHIPHNRRARVRPRNALTTTVLPEAPAAPADAQPTPPAEAAPSPSAAAPRRGLSVGQKLAASLGLLGLAVALVGATAWVTGEDTRRQATL